MARTKSNTAPAEDPVTLRSAILLRQFERYLLWYVGRSFHAVRLAKGGRPLMPTGRSAIVYTNHPSWWDPLVFFLITRFCFPDRPCYAPIDQEALRRYRFFRRLGIFGIDLDRQEGARRFLKIGDRILERPEAMLWVTAQGSFQDARTRPLHLKPGIAHLARRHPNSVLLPLAVEYPFWTERFPEVLLRFGAPIEPDQREGASAAAFTKELEDALAETMDRLADEAASRDPSVFETLLQGRAGIGGLYDAWRRLASYRRGEKFSAAHDPKRS